MLSMQTLPEILHLKQESDLQRQLTSNARTYCISNGIDLQRQLTFALPNAFGSKS